MTNSLQNRSVAAVLVFIFSILLPVSISAQSKGVKISGTVKDSTQKQLSYVTVSLFKGKPSETPVRTTYTNETGKFSFSNIDTGSYTVLFTHTGYSDSQQEIAVAATDIVLPEVKLLQASADLKGVVVTARKPLIEQTDDKIVFNAENDPTTKTETAIDILRKTPFVSVDGDDNVQVNGQTNFKVLLNGRETSMFAQNIKEALKGFPGSLISKIEVITAPSAKYDGEGVGGIINIITKKKVVGYNGSVSTFYSTNRWLNLNANFSAKFWQTGCHPYIWCRWYHGTDGKKFNADHSHHS